MKSQKCIVLWTLQKGEDGRTPFLLFLLTREALSETSTYCFFIRTNQQMEKKVYFPKKRILQWVNTYSSRNRQLLSSPLVLTRAKTFLTPGSRTLTPLGQLIGQMTLFPVYYATKYLSQTYFRHTATEDCFLCGVASSVHGIFCSLKSSRFVGRPSLASWPRIIS